MFVCDYINYASVVVERVCTKIFILYERRCLLTISSSRTSYKNTVIQQAHDGTRSQSLFSHFLLYHSHLTPLTHRFLTYRNCLPSPPACLTPHLSLFLLSSPYRHARLSTCGMAMQSLVWQGGRLGADSCWPLACSCAGRHETMLNAGVQHFVYTHLAAAAAISPVATPKAKSI